MDANNKNNKEKTRMVKAGTVVCSFGFILVFLLFFFAVLIYVFGIRNNYVWKVASVVPYPAALAGSSFVTVGELGKNLESVRMFYEKQDFSEIGTRIDFGSDDGKKRLKIKEKYLLGKLIENKIIEQEAKKRNIKLTKEVVSQEVKRKIDQYGNQESIKEDMENLYGWDMADFEENLVKPDLYREKLLSYLRENDKSYQEAANKIKEAKAELDKKMDFQEAVKKYSEGESAKNSGDLGWFSASEMLSEISLAVFPLEKGKVSDIIESPLGYHIVRVEDKKKEDEVEKVKVFQIFVRTKSIGDWLSEYEKNVRIKIFLKDFYWNQKELGVDFSDPKMVEFEKEAEKNSEGDISIMF